VAYNVEPIIDPLNLHPGLNKPLICQYGFCNNFEMNPTLFNTGNINRDEIDLTSDGEELNVDSDH